MQANVDLKAKENKVQIVEFSLPIKTLDDEKKDKMEELKNKFNELMIRPRVLTSLGFEVDGGYKDLVNFQSGKDLGILIVKDADGETHNIALGDYDLILNAIKAKGLEMYQWKWDTERKIKESQTIEDLKMLGI